MDCIRCSPYSCDLCVPLDEQQLFERYAREYPYEHDGQVGLSAFMDALHAGAFTLAGVFIGLFALQRIVTFIRIKNGASTPT
jgi:hypothetical protein